MRAACRQSRALSILSYSYSASAPNLDPVAFKEAALAHLRNVAACLLNQVPLSCCRPRLSRKKERKKTDNPREGWEDDAFPKERKKTDNPNEG